MIPLRTKARQSQEVRHSLAPGRYLVGGSQRDGLAIEGLPQGALALEVASDAVVAVARCPGFRLGGAAFPVAERRLLRPGEWLALGEVALAVDRPEPSAGDGTAALARGLLAGALQCATESPIPTLLWLNGPDCGKRLPVLDEAVFIGRGEGSAARVRDGLASRVHAKLVVKAGAAKVLDLGSANGLYVDGVRVDGERPLRGGEVLRVGETDLAFEARLPAPAEPPSPVPAPAPAAAPQEKNGRPPTASGSKIDGRRSLAVLELAAITGASFVALGSFATVWLLMH
jgi:hypothetical protein